jgi:hypothetical protein
MVVLGCEKVIMSIDFADKTCILVTLNMVMENLRKQFQVDEFTEDHLFAYAAFLGCDYLDNVKGNSFIAVNNIMPIWCRLSINEKINF